MESDASMLPAALFADACAALTELCGDTLAWKWMEAPPAALASARRTGWLVLKQRLQLPCGVSQQELATRGADSDDPGALAASASNSSHGYSLCVCHNSVFSVPQLLFRGCTAEGAPLSWQATLGDLQCLSAGSLQADSVTPWLHPITGEEWMTLHPCNTRSFLGLMLADVPGPGDKSSALMRYMRAWWSVAGPAVGAPPLPLDAAHACDA
jgi:hypothetical protein